ncbi:MAG: putative baseplate assembly protein [Methanothrix sp.]|nr:putative baseplate assembly protein [Methanothrix sp.]
MPKIIDKTLDEFYEEDRRRALQYVPEWRPASEGDFGLALLKIFSHMREEIASRLNRVPEKSFAAFLSMIGTSLAMAKPSKVPVTFHPAEGFSQSIFIPAGTQVNAPENERHSILIYEVSRGLSVTRAAMREIYSVVPDGDGIFRHTEDLLEGRATVPFQGSSLQEHVLFMGEKKLFKLAEGGRVTLEFVSASEEHIPDMSKLSWHCLTDLGRKELIVSTSDLEKKSLVTLEVPEGELKEEEIFGRTSIWISCRPSESSRQAALFRFSRIKISQVSGGMLPDIGFFNFTPIDLSAGKIFYPFGSQPRATDAFYIASRGVFSKKGSKVTVQFKRERTGKLGEEVRQGQEVELSFEYWNGHLWRPIPQYVDNVNKFLGAAANSTYEGRIEFQCPQDIDETEVGGERNYWIRVMLARGDFGREEMKRVERIVKPGTAEEKVVETTWRVDYSSIKPPWFDRIELEYTTESALNLDGCIAKNNLEYTDFTDESRGGLQAFCPFVLMEDVRPAIYLGFGEKLGRGNLSIFFSIVQERSHVGLKIRWYFWGKDGSNSGWLSLDATDNTDHLARSDTIEFLGPEGQERRRIFGGDLFWIMGAVEGDASSAPIIRGIRPNTAWAEQTETIKEEILGSSSGEKSQGFSLANAPVISSEVWVREGKPLFEEEKRPILNLGHSIEDVRDEAGKVVDAWVLWKPADDFYNSQADSRHYLLDALAGRVLFGDGRVGMIPPAGRENIRASYRIGGGGKGNVAALEISAFRTPVAGVDKISNFEAAEGGSDGEDLSSALERGPRMLKSMDRVVTPEDFQALAKASSSSIARTRCLLEDNRLLVVVIPKGDEEKPMPSQGLIDVVSRYLAERMPASMSSDDVSVQGPSYVEVSISADVVPVTLEGAALLEKRIIDRLKSYLHPLRGGPDGKGWGFARAVQISDIYALIEGTAGVDHVQVLKMESKNMEISGSQMVASGDHRITITSGVRK